MLRSLALLFFLTLSGHGVADSSCRDQHCFAAKVVGISDGDTVTLLQRDGAGTAQIKARLTEIDAPERRQPWGARSRQALANKVFGQTVWVASNGEDRYGRLLARLHLGRRDINREMVREGHAWVYRRYTTENWLPDEASARNAGRGLWSQHSSQAMPPWEWRQRERKARAAQSNARSRSTAVARSTGVVRSARAARSPVAFSCGNKRDCRDMNSCAEARFHLHTCGLAGMDGDLDGVPCERSLCGG